MLRSAWPHGGACGVPLLVRGALRGRQGIQEPLGVGQFGPDRRAVLLQFGLAGAQCRQFLLRLGAQLGDLGDLPLHLGHLGGLAVGDPVHVRGPLQVLVGVGGERQLHGGVDASGAVLGGGEGTECVAGGVEAFGPAGGFVAQRAQGLGGGGRLLLRAVVLLRGDLRLVVQPVHLGLDLGGGELRIGVCGPRQGGSCCGPGEREGGRGAGSRAGTRALLGFSMRCHEGGAPCCRLPVGAYRRARGGPTASPQGERLAAGLFGGVTGPPPACGASVKPVTWIGTLNPGHEEES